jgi:Ca2+-binding EF-hand superfamily protein
MITSDIEEADAMFREFDVDGNGAISERELLEGYR